MKKWVITLLVSSLSFVAHAQSPLSEAQLKEKAQAFIAAKNARQQPDSDVADIEHFLSFLADDFVDEHIKFNVTVTSKDELRKGMVNKLQDKVYFSNISIEQMMFGRNVAFVKYKEHAKVKPSHLDREVEYTSRNILSLEFADNGLIKHIRRHHGL